MCCVVTILVVTAWSTAAGSPVYDQEPVHWEIYEKLWLKDLPRATPDEPLLLSFNEEKAKEFLDDTALRNARSIRTDFEITSRCVASSNAANRGRAPSAHQLEWSLAVASCQNA